MMNSCPILCCFVDRMLLKILFVFRIALFIYLNLSLWIKLILFHHSMIKYKYYIDEFVTNVLYIL